MIGAVIDVVSLVLLLAGAGFYLVGALGLFRMPDVFTRMHAVSVGDTLGAGLLIAGMALQAPDLLTALKLAAILLVLLLTGPVASHALARAALHDGVRPLLAGPDGRLAPVDCRVLFPELRDRLERPLTSETTERDRPAAAGPAEA